MSWTTFSKGCPNFWHILYIYADIDLSASPQQDKKADLIKCITNPINGLLLFPPFSLHLSSTCLIGLSFPLFTSFHVHLSTSCLSSFHHVSLYVFHCSSACPALRFSQANHMDVFIRFLQTNRSPFKWLLTCISINCVCSIWKSLSWHAQIYCIWSSPAVYILLLKVMVKVTLHSVDEIRQVYAA